MSSEFVPFLKGDMDARQHRIYNLPDPEDANEAANKAYVDAGGGSQSVKAVVCDPVTAADLLNGPVTLYTPAAGESVVALYVSEATLSAAAGLIVAPDIPFGTVGTSFAAVGSDIAYDSALFAALVNAGDGSLAALTEPILIGPSTDPVNPTGGAAFARSWQAATVYGTDTPKFGVIEAGHLWQNVGSEGTSDGSQPDFAGNIGGTVVDGADIVWQDLEAFEDVALTAILLVEVAGGGGGGGGGSQPWVGPFEWTFEDYNPDIDGFGTGAIVLPVVIPAGSILQRIAWQIDTALDNVNGATPLLLTQLGDPATDYIDAGDVRNEATELHGPVSSLQLTEPNIIANQALLKDPTGGISPVSVRTSGSGGILVVTANPTFWFGFFDSAPTVGAGRTWFEIFTPSAP